MFNLGDKVIHTQSGEVVTIDARVFNTVAYTTCVGRGESRTYQPGEAVTYLVAFEDGERQAAGPEDLQAV